MLSFLKKWCSFIISCFYLFHPPLTLPLPTLHQADSLTTESGKNLLPGNSIYWLRDDYISFWRWFLVLPRIVFVLLNPWSRYIGIMGELVKRHIAGRHLDISNRCSFNWHPRELHLKKRCILMERLLLCEQNLEISRESGGDNFIGPPAPDLCFSSFLSSFIYSFTHFVYF